MEIFRREGATAKTQGWAPLKQSTLRSRRRRRIRKREKILWDTGKLRRSYVHEPTGSYQ